MPLPAATAVKGGVGGGIGVEGAQLQEKSQIISFKLLKNPSFAIFLMSEAILFIGYFMVFPLQGGFLEMSCFG